MELSHFDAYFHLFAVATLGYAGSETFREFLDKVITDKSRINYQKTNNLLTSAKTNISLFKEPTNRIGLEEKINEKIDIIEVSFNNSIDQIIKENEVECDKFTATFKSMFLISGLYCIAILLIGGLQQYFTCDATIINTLACLDCMLLFTTFIFVRSFWSRFNKPIKLWIPIVSISILLAIDYIYCSRCPMANGNSSYLNWALCIGLALFIPIAPFFFHFLKVIIHKMIYNKKISNQCGVAIAETKKISELIDFIK